jgi:hypothetical protein
MNESVPAAAFLYENRPSEYLRILATQESQDLSKISPPLFFFGGPKALE